MERGECAGSDLPAGRQAPKLTFRRRVVFTERCTKPHQADNCRDVGRGKTILPKQITHNKYTTLIKRLADIIHTARTNAVRQINKAQVLAYYEIGRELVEFEQKGKVALIFNF